MNRIIKFRAWNKDKAVMVYSDEDNSSDYWDGARASDVEMVNSILANGGHYVFQQFTNLLDKNGKEIYEGDVCKYWMDGAWKVGGIGWYRGGWAINVKKYGEEPVDYIFEFQSFIPTPEHQDEQRMTDQFEVIGNIYENPELIKSDHA